LYSRAMETSWPRRPRRQLCAFSAVAIIGAGPAATLSQHGLEAVLPRRLPTGKMQVTSLRQSVAEIGGADGKTPSASSCERRLPGVFSRAAALTAASGALAIGSAKRRLSQGLQRARGSVGFALGAVPASAPLASSLRSRWHRQLMRKAVPLDEADPGSSSSEPLKPELEAMMHELRNYAGLPRMAKLLMMPSQEFWSRKPTSLKTRWISDI